MFYNYLKISLRNLLRHKLFSFINIFGLALGMCCSILIFLWVQDEISYNRFHKNLDQLYRVNEIIHMPGADDVVVFSTPAPLAGALQKEFPEVLYAARTRGEWDYVLSFEGKIFKEKGLYASPEFLKIFTFPLVRGHINNALQAPNSIIISQSLAQKYFGGTDPLGKSLKVDSAHNYKVTAIMQDIPKNSTLEFNFIMSVPDLKNDSDCELRTQWEGNGSSTYLMLRPDANREAVAAKLKDFLNIYLPTSSKELFLQPIKDIYLYSDFRPGREHDGQIRYVRIFSAVAIFVLVIACINFMNLSTARSAKRAREVGVRKVIGAGRFNLVGQFLGEAVLISLCAVIFSVCLVQILLPAFNTLTEKSLFINYKDPVFYLYLFCFALIIGILSGSYPALFLSAFQPSQVLKGPQKFGVRSMLFRKGLVTFQFILSLILIVSALVVYRQVHYIHTLNIGLNRENIIYMPIEGDLKKQAQAFKNELKQASGIKSVTSSDQIPFRLEMSGGGATWVGKDPKKDILFQVLGSDHEFISTMGIQLKEGRYFSKEYSTESEKILLNEEAVRQMQIKNPIGLKINLWGSEGEVIGVVKNFHTTSVLAPMQPLIIGYTPDYAPIIFARTEPGKTKEAIASLQTLTKKFNPAYPFEYHFMDEDYERMYKSETIIGVLANYLAGIAIIISCLGLFGLALFTTEQRTKEIGIRKVLGASVTSIVAMLSKDFLKLVLIANLIAWPLGWYFMNKWLQNYAFRENISWWIFLLAGGVTLIIALITVSFQAINAAVTNPVKSLRSE